MKRKNLKPMIISALLAVGFGATSVGTSFALFTDHADTNISVTAGKVDIASTFTNLAAYSMDPEDNAKEVNRTTEGTFYTGGTFAFDANLGTVTLSKIVPGDRITFDASFTNKSNVDIKYRFFVKVIDDNGLFSGLEVKFGDVALSKTSGVWKTLAASQDFGIDDLKNGTISLTLPKAAGNEYQDKSCTVQFGYEAVQGNADVEDTWTGNTYNYEEVKDYLYRVGDMGLGKEESYELDTTKGFLAFEKEDESSTTNFAKYILKHGTPIETGKNEGRAIAAASEAEYNAALTNARAVVEAVEAVKGFDIDQENRKILVSSADALQVLSRSNVYLAAKTMLTYNETNSLFNDFYYGSSWKCEVLKSINLNNVEWKPVIVSIPVDFKGNYVSNLKVTTANENGGLFASARGVTNLYVENANIEVNKNNSNAMGAVVAAFNAGNSLSNITVKNATVLTGGTCAILSAYNYAKEMNNNRIIDSSAKSELDHEVGALAGIYNAKGDCSALNNSLYNVSFEAYDREVGSLMGRFYADGNSGNTLRIENTSLKKVSLKVNIQDAVSNVGNQGTESTKFLGIYVGGRFAENNTVEFKDNCETTLTYEGGLVKINY